MSQQEGIQHWPLFDLACTEEEPGSLAYRLWRKEAQAPIEVL